MSTSVHSEWVTGCRVSACLSASNLPRHVCGDVCLYAHRGARRVSQTRLLRQRCPLLKVVV